MLSIPLSMQMVADRRIWHFECDGKFYVRSAYHMEMFIGSAVGDEVSGSAS